MKNDMVLLPHLKKQLENAIENMKIHEIEIGFSDITYLVLDGKKIPKHIRVRYNGGIKINSNIDIEELDKIIVKGNNGKKWEFLNATRLSKIV